MTKKDDVCTIVFAGDYHPTDTLSSILKNRIQPSDLFGPVIFEIENADFSVVNLEVPATAATKKIPKAGPHGKTDERCIKWLAKGGFNLVTFATNHTLDYGVEGVKDTLLYCKKYGM